MELLNEISKEIYNHIKDYMLRVSEYDKTFDNIFGNKTRIIFQGEKESNETILLTQEFLSANGWSLDKQNQLVSKQMKIEIPKGPKKGQEITKSVKIKLSKVLSEYIRLFSQYLDNSEEEKDEKKRRSFFPYDSGIEDYRIESRLRQIKDSIVPFWEEKGELAKNSKESDRYYIILSRSPVDVLRMSDAGDIHSCYSEGREFHRCAISEAKEGGIVAYKISEEEYEKLDDLDSEEIFKDEKRGVEGIVPEKRVLVRKFVNNEDNIKLAVPEIRIYGSGGYSEGKDYDFYSSLRKKLNELQKEEIKKVDENTFSNFVRYGGTYSDTSDGELFYKFTGKKELKQFERENVVHEQDYEETSEYRKIYEDVIDEFNNSSKYIKIEKPSQTDSRVRVFEEDDIYAEANVKFSSVKEIEASSIKEVKKYIEELSKELSGDFGGVFPSLNLIQFRVEYHSSDFEDVDVESPFRYFINVLKKDDEKIQEIVNLSKKKMKEFAEQSGYIDIEKIISKNKNYDVFYEEKNGAISVKVPMKLYLTNDFVNYVKENDLIRDVESVWKFSRLNSDNSELLYQVYSKIEDKCLEQDDLINEVSLHKQNFDYETNPEYLNFYMTFYSEDLLNYTEEETKKLISFYSCLSTNVQFLDTVLTKTFYDILFANVRSKKSLKEEEPYQRLMRKKHPKYKKFLIGLGGHRKKEKGFSSPDFSRSESAPPIGESIELYDIDKLKTKKSLYNKFWQKDKIRYKVRRKLLKIANDFIKEFPFDAKIYDIVLTGSLANYNWTEYSDIDLHILLNYEEITDKYELVKNFFDLKRYEWNTKHNIILNQHDVEIYVQDINEVHHSSGVYSLVKDEWINKPKKQAIQFNKQDVEKKVKYFLYSLSKLKEMYESEKYKVVNKKSEKLISKLKKMRSSGLEKKGEFSVENLAFKVLRNGGYIDDIYGMKLSSYDKEVGNEDSAKRDEV